MSVTVNVPQVRDSAYALRVWYEQTEIGRTDICKIFQCSTSTATKLKRAVQEQMALKACKVYNAKLVNTRIAFETWGLDAGRMETAIKKLGLRFG